MLCLSGFELYSRWVPLHLPKNGHKKSDAGIKDAFEEIEHEFPLETFRPRKQGRFPFNQNVRFEFRQLPVANGTAFSKIPKNGTT